MAYRSRVWGFLVPNILERLCGLLAKCTTLPSEPVRNRLTSACLASDTNKPVAANIANERDFDKTTSRKPKRYTQNGSCAVPPSVAR